MTSLSPTLQTFHQFSVDVSNCALMQIVLELSVVPSLVGGGGGG